MVQCGNQIQLRQSQIYRIIAQLRLNHGDHLSQLSAKSKVNFKISLVQAWRSHNHSHQAVLYSQLFTVRKFSMHLFKISLTASSYHFSLLTTYASLRKLMSFSNSPLSKTITSHFNALLQPQNKANNLSNMSIHTVCPISLPLLVK